MLLLLLQIVLEMVLLPFHSNRVNLHFNCIFNNIAMNVSLSCLSYAMNSIDCLNIQPTIEYWLHHEHMRSLRQCQSLSPVFNVHHKDGCFTGSEALDIFAKPFAGPWSNVVDLIGSESCGNYTQHILPLRKNNTFLSNIDSVKNISDQSIDLGTVVPINRSCGLTSIILTPFSGNKYVLFPCRYRTSHRATDCITARSCHEPLYALLVIGVPTRQHCTIACEWR
mmetsp:Transcript_8704/g.18355  ORF Transcript_8704/g.18355 Transcript_8704/m.18355 type:complete len:224 (+) Transcript_8704:476-1147(+)